MADLPLNTEPPFGGMRPEWYEREAESRREANEHARFLARYHGLRDPVAWTAALAQRGMAAPSRIGTTESTVGDYLDQLEERFGVEATAWQPPAERTGPLDETGGSEAAGVLEA